MKNFSKAEDFSHRKKRSRNDYVLIAGVLARGMGKTKFIGPWMLDARCWMLVRR